MRERWRRRVAVFVVLLVGLVGVLLASATAAAADPTPASAGRTSASAPPLRVTLPGLLTVTVDQPQITLPKITLPKVKLELGGDRNPESAGSTTAPSAPTPTATSGSAAPTTSGPARVVPVTSGPARPERRTGRSSQAPLRADTVVDTRARPDRPARKAATADPKPAAPRAAAEKFQRMLRSGLPIWLLAGIVVLCGGGTVLVVRTAGRRPGAVARPKT